MANENENKGKPSIQNQNRGNQSDQGDADLRALVEKQAKQIEELRDILMATIRTQSAVTPDSVWAKQHEKEMKIKEELDRLAAYHEMDAKRRTQYEANKLNQDGKKLFKISVGWCPEVVIRANDQVAAKGYYDKVCHILAVNPIHGQGKNEYKIIDVTDDPEAKKLAGMVWEYQQAA